MTFSLGIELGLIATLIAAIVPLATLRGGESAHDQLALADKKFDEREYAQAGKLYESVATFAEQEGDTSTLIEALSQVARCYLTQGDFEGCKKWLPKAEALASEKFPAGWVRFLGVKGRLHWRENRNEDAMVLFKQMYDVGKKHNLPARYLDAAHMIAIVGNPEEQIEWGKRGIAEAEAETGENRRWLAPMYNNLAANYADQGRFEDSYAAFTKAREYHWQYSGEAGKLYAEYQVGWILYKLGRFDEALKWLRPSLAWAERLGNDDVQAQACDDMGEIAIAQGKGDEGLALLNRSLEHAKKAGYETGNPEIYKKLQARVAELQK